MLKDSKASFAIEKESPSPDRARRWAAIVGEAGTGPVEVNYLLELQQQVIGPSKFVQFGWRTEGGFVGSHDALNQPRPVHISARHEDIEPLIEGIIAFDRLSSFGRYHPVLAAASIGFGFVYVHPFEDGNGRIHRYLLHHVLAEHGLTPPNIIFPISAAIEKDMLAYRKTLESVSQPILSHIDWTATDKGNVTVTNDTADLYRFFDATANAEYLFECIDETIKHDLPDELSFLELRDRFHYEGTRIVDMPERTLDTLLHVLRQNHGEISKRKRQGIFEQLTDEQAAAFEVLYADLQPQ